MSGWSTSSTTILAARRVLPPRLDRAGPRVGAAHERHGPGGQAALGELLLGGADLREVDARARAAAEDHALLGVPGEDRLHRVLDREDEAGRALRLSSKPTLNQTGELKAASWLTRMWLSSASNASASSATRSSGPRGPSSAIVPATRPTICLTECSRCGVPSWPRKYFCATMLVAFCDQLLRELDVALLEGRLGRVADQRVARLPLDLVERVHAGRVKRRSMARPRVGRVDAVGRSDPSLVLAI